MKGDVPDFVINPRLAIAPDSAMVRRAAPPAVKGKGAGKRRKVKPAQAGHEGKLVMGERVVDDPIEKGAKQRARVNVAEHVLDMMLSRKRLEEAHYVAGVKFRAIYERAQIGSCGGIDPGKVKVDGGGASDPLDGGVAEAHLELSRLAGWLGPVGYRLVEKVAGSGITIADLAKEWPSDAGDLIVRNYLTLRLKEALQVLAAEVWGATGPARGRIAGWSDGEKATAQGVETPQTADANAKYWRRKGMARG